ncbi:MAG TPA: DUF4232 domain-containing protein [Acidimicrobiales bacterium]|nr:DUF4232 domain-containing protein [Acidimicrobiales bacterium]
MRRPQTDWKRIIGVAALASAAVFVPLATLLAAAPAPPAGAAGAPGCATSGLVVWLDTEGIGTAGATYYNLEFTNLSGRTCTMYAYPGVSAINLAGGQLGSAAHYSSLKRPVVVTLADGGTATAVVRITDTGVYPPSRCHQVQAAGLRVYPPDQLTARVVPFPFLACSRSGPIFLNVQPVEKGTSG